MSKCLFFVADRRPMDVSGVRDGPQTECPRTTCDFSSGRPPVVSVTVTRVRTDPTRLSVSPVP